MASCSTYLANKILGYVFGKRAFTPDDDLEMALFSTIPNSDGSGGTELPSTGGYARAALTNDTDTFAVPSSRRVLNDVEFTFENDGSAGDWLTAVAWKLFDSGGNVYTFGLLSPSVKIRAFQSRSFAAGALIQNLT